MKQALCRMTDKTRKPTEEEIESFLGERAREAWSEIRRFIEDHYDFAPETVFYGAKYGWTIRYRKSGKTLCSLFPERGGFTVLIVLGKKESEKVLSMREELSSEINKLLGGTEQLHDGRWLWIRLLTTKDTDDVKKLLQIKRKPKKT
ncbi:MAG: DUF3788 domain-containing protein [Candidatus Bathyarchaeia archaeon]